MFYSLFAWHALWARFKSTIWSSCKLKELTTTLKDIPKQYKKEALKRQALATFNQLNNPHRAYCDFCFIDLQYCPKLSPRERCYVFEGTWKGGDKEKKALTVKVTSWFLLFNSYIRPQWLQVGYVENNVIPCKDGGRNWHFTFCLFFVSFVGSYSVSAFTQYLLKG